MKVFILDDGSWLSKLADSKASEETMQIYCLKDESYKTSKDIDEFFYQEFLGKKWVENNARGEGEMKALSDLIDPHLDNEAVFLIGVNARMSGCSSRQNQDGVEVLKHIRLTEELRVLCDAHVVLYSFETPEVLLRRKPGNLIMFSSGVTLLRLPEESKYLLDPKWLNRVIGNKANRTSYSFTPFVACDYRQPDSAHQYSNWWGMRQFVMARRILENNEKILMPSKVVEELRILENKKAFFLNHYDQNISTNIDGTKLSQLESQLNDLEFFFAERLNYRDAKILYLDDEPGWGKIVKTALEKVSRGRIQVKTPLVNSQSDTSVDAGKFLFLLKGKINKEWLKKELCLDDIKNEPSLVLLDLRMRGSSEVNTPVSETSGAVLACEIRKLRPALPIILMTASNKAWTFEQALKSGIDGYWMKEGIGEHALPGESVANYLNLLRLIRAALGEEYATLRCLTSFILELSDPGFSAWWENSSNTWADGTHSSANRKEILSKLLNIRIIYHEFLRATKMAVYLTNESKKTDIERILFLGICTEIRFMIEMVHDFSSGTAVLLNRNGVTSRKKFTELLQERGDSRAASIFRTCSLVMHNQTESRKKKQQESVSVLELITNIKTYLCVTPVTHTP